MTRLPENWQTNRLTIQDGTPQDVPWLMTIFNACSHFGPWDPTFQIYPEETFAELVASSVDSGMGNGRFQLQTLRFQMHLIGYYHCYHHNPQPQTLFISMLVLHPNQQKEGFGTELVTTLAQQAKSCGYQAIWLDVYLKNWPALRFWIKSGFTTIIEMDGAPQHNPTAHASLVLAKTL
jgi:ribosomal protein S18 acetylase RimI-like enzyme